MQKVMSALPPKADMCSALGDVRFVPKADILQCEPYALYPRKRTFNDAGRKQTPGSTRRPEIDLDRSGPTTASGVNLLGYPKALEIPMTVSMVDRPADKKEASPWPADIAAEFERESKNPNPCVGTTLLSENERTRVWIIRLASGERLGFHRHVLDYFWTAISGSRGRAHVQDGTTVEYTYQPNETRHGRLGKGEFTVHDLENISDHEMVFVAVEFKDSANKPMALPSGVKPQ